VSPPRDSFQTETTSVTPFQKTGAEFGLGISLIQKNKNKSTNRNIYYLFGIGDGAIPIPMQVPVKDLVSDYEATNTKLKETRIALNALEQERSALFNLITARGGGDLLNRPQNPRHRLLEMANEAEDISASGQYGVIKALIPEESVEFTSKVIFYDAKKKLPSITLKAVTFNLSRLAKEGFIKVIVPGRGRREGSYSRVSGSV
jgi:hypothetical protein